MTDEALKRQITVHTEKTKRTAGATNTPAVALVGGGFIVLLAALSFSHSAAPPPGPVTLITGPVWALVARGLPWWARSLLESLP